MRADLDAWDRPAPDGRRRSTIRGGSVLAEALGYLGGAIIVAGSLLIGARYWEELETGWRFGIVAATALVLLGARARVPADLAAAGDRLRSVLWLASTAAIGGSLAILTRDVVELDDRDVVLAVALGTAAYATALWLAVRSVLQQLAMMLAFATTAAALINRADVSADLPGLAVWGVGVVWALLGSGGVLRPRRLAAALGTGMAIFGAMLTGGSDAGMVLVMVTICAVVSFAIATRDPLVVGVGALGALVNLPAAMSRWFPDSVAAAVALVVVGAAMVGAAVRTRGAAVVSGPGADATVSPRIAMAASAAVVVAVAGAVIAVALL